MEDRLKAVTLEKDYWMLQASAISTNFQAVAMQHQVSASSNQAPQQDWFDNEREKSELMSTVAITKADVDKFEKEKSLAELKIKLEQDKNSSLEKQKGELIQMVTKAQPVVQVQPTKPQYVDVPYSACHATPQPSTKQIA